MATHDGGYSTFRADLTDGLAEENVLTVIADNSKNDHVYPQRADFTFYGGIYRDVYLITVEAVHFDLDYYGGNGFQITPQVDGRHADVKLQAYVSGKADTVTFQIPGVGEASVPVSYDSEGNGLRGDCHQHRPMYISGMAWTIPTAMTPARSFTAAARRWIRWIPGSDAGPTASTRRRDFS